MAKNGYTAAEKPYGYCTRMLKSLSVAFLLTFLALCLLAFLITWGPVTEKAAAPCILLTSVVSMFVAGFMAAARILRRGMVVGMLAGVLYVVVAYILGVVICGSFSPNGAFLKMAALGIALGGLGGILGINAKRKKY